MITPHKCDFIYLGVVASYMKTPFEIRWCETCGTMLHERFVKPMSAISYSRPWIHDGIVKVHKCTWGLVGEVPNAKAKVEVHWCGLCGSVGLKTYTEPEYIFEIRRTKEYFLQCVEEKKIISTGF